MSVFLSVFLGVEAAVDPSLEDDDASVEAPQEVERFLALHHSDKLRGPPYLTVQLCSVQGRRPLFVCRAVRALVVGHVTLGNTTRDLEVLQHVIWR